MGEIVITLASLIKDDPSAITVVFCFVALLLYRPLKDVLEWMIKKKKVARDTKVTDVKLENETFVLHESAKDKHIEQLMIDIEKLKQSMESQAERYNAEIKKLGEKIESLESKIEHLNETINDKKNDNYRLAASVKLKNHEILQLRQYIERMKKKLGNAADWDPVPEFPVESRRRKDD